MYFLTTLGGFSSLGRMMCYACFLDLRVSLISWAGLGLEPPSAHVCICWPPVLSAPRVAITCWWSPSADLYCNICIYTCIHLLFDSFICVLYLSIYQISSFHFMYMLSMLLNWLNWLIGWLVDWLNWIGSVDWTGWLVRWLIRLIAVVRCKLYVDGDGDGDGGRNDYDDDDDAAHDISTSIYSSVHLFI